MTCEITAKKYNNPGTMRNGKPKPKKPRELVLPDSAYQPSKAEMSETVSFDGSLEELAEALFQPVKIRRVKDWKRS